MRLRPWATDESVPVVSMTDDNMCHVHPETCRWGCGNQCAHPAPNPSANETFESVVARFVSRRRVLTGSAAALGMLVVGGGAVASSTRSTRAASEAAAATSALAFTPISLSSEDRVIVPSGYTSNVLVRWGDPLFADSKPFEFGKQTAADQERQFGYNNDWLGFIRLSDRYALLLANHEYTNPELMFPGYSAASPTKEQVDYELAAHGFSIVMLEKDATKTWQVAVGAWPNRRLTGVSPTMLTGPAAGHALLRTTEDPGGYRVKGTLNNCSAGITPWGTVLTCEENFNQYFANMNGMTDAAKKAIHQRYGLTANASERKWERFYDRFDLTKEPNEAFRYGWVTEIDPQDPSFLPRKRTALGRVKHEAATTVLAKDGRAVVYTGDDERFDYMYKFVSAGKANLDDRAANIDLLDSGTLYVAKYNDDGSGNWLPLVWGQGRLTPANGFADQAEVLIKARLAGDAVGATKMDRPEDIEVNPVNNRVYCVMTNNTQRGVGTNAAPGGPNPRAENKHGHIIELIPDGGDHASLTFTWGIFMLCGDPAKDANTYFAGYSPSAVSPISSPDNITFDNQGNLWIATDGQTSTFLKNDGVFVVPVEGAERGYLRQFFSGVPGGETSSLILSDSNDALFVSIQHPAEGSKLDAPTSHFPDGKEPRPAVVMVTKNGGGTIGS